MAHIRNEQSAPGKPDAPGYIDMDEKDRKECMDRHNPHRIHADYDHVVTRPSGDSLYKELRAGDDA